MRHAFWPPPPPADPALERCVRDPRGDVGELIACLQDWVEARDALPSMARDEREP